MKDKKLGIKALAYFYLCLAFFYTFPIFIFSTQVVIAGWIAGPFLAKAIHACFIGLFFFLYLSMRRAKKTGLRPAIGLHALFFINNILMAFSQVPVLEIKGVKLGSYIQDGPIILLSAAINFLVIAYLLRQKKLFS